MKSIVTFLAILVISVSGFSQENISKSEHSTMSTVWYQKSAEMKALYYQAFNIAMLKLEEKLQHAEEGKQYAVVCDIDETLLNNSPFQGKLILENYFFSDSLWQEWTKLAKAEALPGALDFALFAASKNVRVFYLSNRSVDELEWTMKNMQEIGFPNVEEEFYLLKTTTSDKEERRSKVRENYEILLFCGDNLGDFSSVYDHRGDDLGFDDIEEMKEMFGDKYIVLPNPMYGTWEKSIYGNTYGKSPEEKNKLRKEVLESF